MDEPRRRGADTPTARITPGPEAGPPEAPRRVRLYVSLPADLHHVVQTWAKWNRVDVSGRVEEFLRGQVAEFHAGNGLRRLEDFPGIRGFPGIRPRDGRGKGKGG